MPHRYPVLLDVTDIAVLVVGAGKVGARKISGLIDAGARNVSVVSMTFPLELPDGVRRVKGRFEGGQLDGVDLVFAATDSAVVNARVVSDARARGVLVSRADAGDGPEGNFVTPAKFERGATLVTVSAGSAALAVTIRDGIVDRWDDRWTAMADTMTTLRPVIRNHPALTADRRATIFNDLATEAALDQLAAKGDKGLLTWLKARHPDLRDA